MCTLEVPINDILNIITCIPAQNCQTNMASSEVFNNLSRLESYQLKQLTF